MTARTHDIFAFASLLTVAAINPPSSLNLYTLSASVVGNIIGALLPDIDQGGNKLWDLLPAGNFVGRIGRKVFYEHRAITHSLVGAYLIYRILEFILPKIFNSGVVDIKILVTSIMIGFFSHLVADSVTHEGIPLFFPISFNVGFPPLPALRMKTGGIVEKFLVFPGIVIFIFWLFATKHKIFLQILRLI